MEPALFWMMLAIAVFGPNLLTMLSGLWFWLVKPRSLGTTKTIFGSGLALGLINLVAGGFFTIVFLALGSSAGPESTFDFIFYTGLVVLILSWVWFIWAAVRMFKRSLPFDLAG